MASVTEELKELAALLEKGLITRKQFEAQRDRLLAEAEQSSSVRTSSPGVLDQVGAYTILGTIGEGGMGAVYRGRHRNSAIAKRQGGDVAVKLMHARLAKAEQFRNRFEREATLGLELDHPGIVRVHDLVLDAGQLALVMELVEGRPLSEVIGRETGPLPWSRARPMIEQLLDAVEHAHGSSVVHRDLKPENVLVTPDDRLKVLDFGIAKDVSAGATRTGTAMGTVAYMAPEQYLDAKNVDARADIYALGMTLYEMLAGRLPWDEETAEYEILKRKEQGSLPPPTDFYPDIPEAVVAGVLGALAVDLEERWPSISAFRQGLLTGAAPPAPEASPEPVRPEPSGAPTVPEPSQDDEASSEAPDSPEPPAPAAVPAAPGPDADPSPGETAAAPTEALPGPGLGSRTSPGRRVFFVVSLLLVLLGLAGGRLGFHYLNVEYFYWEGQSRVEAHWRLVGMNFSSYLFLLFGLLVPLAALGRRAVGVGVSFVLLGLPLAVSLRGREDLNHVFDFFPYWAVALAAGLALAARSPCRLRVLAPAWLYTLCAAGLLCAFLPNLHRYSGRVLTLFSCLTLASLGGLLLCVGPDRSLKRRALAAGAAAGAVVGGAGLFVVLVQFLRVGEEEMVRGVTAALHVPLWVGLCCLPLLLYVRQNRRSLGPRAAALLATAALLAPLLVLVQRMFWTLLGVRFLPVPEWLHHWSLQLIPLAHLVYVPLIFGCLLLAEHRWGRRAEPAEAQA